MKGLFVEFNQDPFFYKKEGSGKKRNIVVKKTLDKRFVVLYACMRGINKNPLKLIVCNSETKERFIVNVTDISYFNGYYIVSWGLKTD